MAHTFTLDIQNMAFAPGSVTVAAGGYGGVDPSHGPSAHGYARHLGRSATIRRRESHGSSS